MTVKGKRLSRKRSHRSTEKLTLFELDPYLTAWMALTPAERMRRSWRLRTRLKDPEAAHDAKTFPEL
jgi:hypothetical protein